MIHNNYQSSSHSPIPIHSLLSTSKNGVNWQLCTWQNFAHFFRIHLCKTWGEGPISSPHPTNRGIASGNLLHNYGTSPFFMWNFPWKMVIVHIIVMLVYQRVESRTDTSKWCSKSKKTGHLYTNPCKTKTCWSPIGNESIDSFSWVENGWCVFSHKCLWNTLWQSNVAMEIPYEMEFYRKLIHKWCYKRVTNIIVMHWSWYSDSLNQYTQFLCAWMGIQLYPSEWAMPNHRHS